jgi:hypothetical protein
LTGFQGLRVCFTNPSKKNVVLANPEVKRNSDP